MKYRMILIDADNTLFDFDKAEANALSSLFRNHGLQEESDLLSAYHEINEKLWTEFEKNTITQDFIREERFRQLFDRYGIDRDPKEYGEIYLKYLADSSVLFSDSKEVCSYLSKKYLLAIVTNGITEVQKSRLARSEIREFISALIISEEAKSGKPGKEIFDYALRKMNFHEKDKILMVGDSLTSDILGGNNFGIDTCWLNRKRIPNATKIKPTFEIETLLELKKLL